MLYFTDLLPIWNGGRIANGWAAAVAVAGLMTFANGCRPKNELSESKSVETSQVVKSRVEANSREPIYDEKTPGDQLISAALTRAKREHKHVLIEWGGNWCGWCYSLHDTFMKDNLVQPIVYEEFELVLVESRLNRELLLAYGGRDREYSFPHLTILDTEGKVLVNQNTEPLELGEGHDPQSVAKFLTRWLPEKLDAETELTNAYKLAATENKKVLFRVGDPYCGWCKILTSFIGDNQEILGKAFVSLKIDTQRMRNGEVVANRFKPKDCSGVPWMAILDASGKLLADSMNQEGNIGYPYQTREIEHFLSMLRSTTDRLGEEDVEHIRVKLERYRTEREATAAASQH